MLTEFEHGRVYRLSEIGAFTFAKNAHTNGLRVRLRRVNGGAWVNYANAIGEVLDRSRWQVLVDEDSPHGTQLGSYAPADTEATQKIGEKLFVNSGELKVNDEDAITNVVVGGLADIQETIEDYADIILELQGQREALRAFSVFLVFLIGLFTGVAIGFILRGILDIPVR